MISLVYRKFGFFLALFETKFQITLSTSRTSTVEVVVVKCKQNGTTPRRTKAKENIPFLTLFLVWIRIRSYANDEDEKSSGNRQPRNKIP